MEKERIKEGLRALYPKVGEELIEAAATYPDDSMVGKFIARIIARAASYGHAKETIGDLCPVGHELNRMLGGVIGEAKPPTENKTWAGMEAITFEEWKQNRRGLGKKMVEWQRKIIEEMEKDIDEMLDLSFTHDAFDSRHFEPWHEPKRGVGFNEKMTSFDIAQMMQSWQTPERWNPNGELKLRDDLECGEPGGIKWATFDFGKPEELSEDDKIIRVMMGMNDPRLSGTERDIWIVVNKQCPVDKDKLDVWGGRYTQLMGAVYTEGGRLNGDWLGWMEKDDYSRPETKGNEPTN